MIWKINLANNVPVSISYSIVVFFNCNIRLILLKNIYLKNTVNLLT